jgi:hypothetical protein
MDNGAWEFSSNPKIVLVSTPHDPLASPTLQRPIDPARADGEEAKYPHRTSATDGWIRPALSMQRENPPPAYAKNLRSGFDRLYFRPNETNSSTKVCRRKLGFLTTEEGNQCRVRMDLHAPPRTKAGRGGRRRTRARGGRRRGVLRYLRRGFGGGEHGHL